MRERIASVRTRIRTGLERAFAAEHTPHEIAASFAFGVFIVAMPTAGTAFALFALVAYFVNRASKLALAATLVVFNPPVKWAVYGASFWLGSYLLGPVPGVSLSDVSLTAGIDIVLRQLLGNTILAVAMALVGYMIVLQLAQFHRRRKEVGTNESWVDIFS
ncbi:DUF2062 domain-containing protein [Haloferax mediterranei ATCC 33500]|uniref:DUF2062 domain-containing protein n=1 Tax=Haloferax mediterranei (strain ATCC 33500 / DSM 1411 / JCM 8866 / NBRC 14739 / NCIMB 2177 / R-4) TaxID=523841 RepID=I3R7E1_HALMT|nr:DUF2062 domain-containing protein [Haloferax mediterranei]AFK20151.1 hypothetical protein HFX_2468 [Haloferax mediterranei ATCC 33500]AHZ23524.1 hypothetical protein BM92_13135 [Haloferax mediterranei ATCC 33500]ELZ99699.1 hypothetical protein C439_14134 [Haloferax mediterranei ATCC 33500]MDX5987097.1 DUF2062 domain-containing protein [Haloferax mediterranei ATCC 33500]QCQ76411.1 DUF2062 domain-containing protein [Haloferax mediterranei ATCC 33500]